jgi:hypothetical protein
MKPLDLTKALKKYKSGWVAIDERKKEVVAYSKDFKSINKKIENKQNVVLMAASDDYYGLIT